MNTCEMSKVWKINKGEYLTKKNFPLATCLVVNICMATSKFSKPLIINSVVTAIQNNKLQLFVLNEHHRRYIYSFGCKGYIL